MIKSTVYCDFCGNHEELESGDLGRGWYRIRDYKGDAENMCVTCHIKASEAKA